MLRGDRVDDDALADLDWCERADDRVDVTERSNLIDPSASVRLDDPIAVYVPRPAAIVDTAFTELGAHRAEWYRRTPPPDVPVVDITLDPLPARRPRER